MNGLLRIGRYIFAIPIIAFGIQCLLYGRFVGGLPPVPPWAPGGAVGAYVVGVFLIASGISIVITRKARGAALLLGSVFLLCVLFLHGPRMRDILVDGIARTRALEPLALSGVAFVLAATLANPQPGPSALSVTNHSLLRWGHYRFALPMVIFGVQHFQFVQVIAGLIPS
jgi:uncharacterized membrane protein